MLSVPLLLLLAIGVRWAGVRFVPLAVPPGKLIGVGSAFLGGVAGNLIAGLFWPAGPAVVGVHLGQSLAGMATFLLAVGLAPFLKILGGRY